LYLISQITSQSLCKGFVDQYFIFREQQAFRTFPFGRSSMQQHSACLDIPHCSQSPPIWTSLNAISLRLYGHPAMQAASFVFSRHTFSLLFPQVSFMQYGSWTCSHNDFTASVLAGRISPESDETSSSSGSG